MNPMEDRPLSQRCWIQAASGRLCDRDGKMAHRIYRPTGWIIIALCRLLAFNLPAQAAPYQMALYLALGAALPGGIIWLSPAYVKRQGAELWHQKISERKNSV